MSGAPPAAAQYDVLILAPSGNDAGLTQDILKSAGIQARICADARQLFEEARRDVGSILVAEEALDADTMRSFAEVVARQPAWSDLPTLVLSHQGADSAVVAAALESLGNVTLLERPVRIATLVSAVRVALRARARQYELRERFAAQALLAAIVTSSDDAMVSKTLDGTILSWNAAAERMFGYTAQEAIGQAITLIVPQDRLAEERMILDRLKRGERIEHFETIRRTKGGQLIPISLTISPIHDASDHVIAASKVARDISAQKRAEQALRDADQRKDEFLATLAHELRNPLAPLRSSLHVLQLAGANDPAVAQVSEMMERQIHQMVRLVDDLMEVSRITRGNIELRKERVDLAAVVASAVETSQPLIAAGGHRLVIALPEEPVVLDADPVRLAQVFSNLLNNAAKYTVEAGRIDLTARRAGDAVEVSVRDTGIGISPEMLGRVFEMFTQVKNADRHGVAGLGIGLTLVRSLVEMHGGNVTAASAGPGQGSEFVVRLPVAPGLPPETAPPPSQAAALLPLRVLVVDDNRDAADSLATLLKHLGAETEVAYDGASALAALRERRKDVVLLDIGMPGMDGNEVARRVRQDPALAGLVLIALTGWGQEDDRRRSRAAGFDHHLIKPTDIEALRSLILSVPQR